MSKTLRGALWMSGAVLSFCAMAIAARQLLKHIGVFEVLFFRTAVALLIVLAFALRTGIATLRTRRFGLHLWRNGVHLGGQASWVYAIGALPLATVFAIEFTSPIWTAVRMSMIRTPFCLAAALPGWTSPAIADLPWILVIGIGSFTAHYCMTRPLMFPGAALIFAGVWFSLARENRIASP